MVDASRYQLGFVPPAGVDEDGLGRLVDAFYAKVRDDEVLGPIFNREVADWPEHLDKLKRFWASTMLKARTYDGRPLPPHLKLPEISDAHFARWLELFRQTAAEEMPGIGAPAVTAMAERIATSFRMAIAFHRGEDSTKIGPL
ncbi:MAG: group III truncated hemoglobin [Rhodoblastus sp.]